MIFKKLRLYLNNGEIWKYTCKNGHKWESLQSPKGTYLYGEDGQTKCRICKTPICKGDKYINGKLYGGAIHQAFK